MKIIFILFSFCFISCFSRNIKYEIEILKSDVIKIPFTGRYITRNNDTISSVATMKMIIYIDSSLCNPCQARIINEWESYVEYAKKCKGKLRLFFIFRPKNNELNSIRNAIKLSEFDYPTCIDEDGDFEKLNPHLPKNKALHTFLLDENNKVILVGNPLHNKEIEKLFYKITQEKLSK